MQIQTKPFYEYYRMSIIKGIHVTLCDFLYYALLIVLCCVLSFCYGPLFCVNNRKNVLKVLMVSV